uniref:Nucleolar protein 10 n=1 Tax=Ascaris lumbricoides TaxID=6252 RepID=A0A0M3I7R9_ASCLU
MQVSLANDVKIYNLSAGKSIPEWISDRKRRKLEQKDIGNLNVSLANDVKIYNLSAGKSIPEWISDRKRRKLEQKDIDIRRRIQLIQDFDMPDVSHTVNVSPDGRYIFATGMLLPYIDFY